MTGRGHRWTGVGAAFLGAAAAHLAHLPELIGAAAAAASTTVPDWIEFPVYRNGQRKGALITHRTVTHWPPLWLALAIFGIHEGGFTGALALGVAIGSFTHILADAPNPMGIPWYWPTKRLKIGKKGLWRSGEHEPFLALVFATFGFVVWSLAGGRILTM
ncbi:metal-dependent hydrolase [Paraburkholderia sp. EG287A]|uniref:metal-dependent hydrolase n=1 Tax=Paraburkholderia sp. EG287A TaxID=3237012 RepID=UPI0034D2E13F